MKTKIIFLFLIIFSVMSFSLNSYLNDNAGLFTYSEQNSLENALRRFEKKTGIEFAIFIEKDIKGSDIDSKTQELFDKYRPGKKNKDNGILMLIALKEKKIKIEPGYGLEGVLNDGKIGGILDDYFVPMAKAGNIKKAIVSTISGVFNAISPENYTASSSNRKKTKKESPLSAIFHIFIVFIFIIIVIKNPSLLFWILMFSGNGGGSNFGSGDGFGGFGGGSSGGGGASRGW